MQSVRKGGFLVINKYRINILTITDCQLPTYIGCRDWEQTQRQVVNVTLMLTYSDIIINDQVDHCYEYIGLTRKIINEFTNRHHNLIETLAHRIAEFIVVELGVESVQVAVRKESVVPWVKSAEFVCVH